MDSFRFRPEERIGLDREVEIIMREGRRFSNEALTIVWMDRASLEREKAFQSPPVGKEAKGSERRRVLPPRRIAIRVPHRAGNAVRRNRLKRILRETFRREKSQIRSQTDLVLIVKPTVGERMQEYFKMGEMFRSLCRKSGIWLGKERE